MDASPLLWRAMLGRALRGARLEVGRRKRESTMAVDVTRTREGLGNGRARNRNLAAATNGPVRPACTFAHLATYDNVLYRM